eukprot:10852896-Heterocapsa_arctica.AAC.1
MQQADSFGRLWGVGPDFVLTRPDPPPVPLKTLAMPYALNPPFKIMSALNTPRKAGGNLLLHRVKLVYPLAYSSSLAMSSR